MPFTSGSCWALLGVLQEGNASFLLFAESAFALDVTVVCFAVDFPTFCRLLCRGWRCRDSLSKALAASSGPGELPL